jgi:hypothetical protein
MLAALLALALAAPVPSSRHFPSLQGGETLGAGSSVAAFSAGFTMVSASWAQALSDGADAGALLDFDLASTELVAGGLYRQIAWRSGDVAVAWRAKGGFYADVGSTWVYDANRSATGLRVTPGLAASTQTGRGLLSLGADFPFTFTFDRGGGFAVGVLGAVSFETPLWGDLSAGARVGGGALWSYSGAPFASDSPRALVDIAALLTYRLF